jgi:hypothetical protein
MISTRTLIAAAIAAGLFAGTSAFAQEATSDVWTQAPSIATRAEVQAEAVAALRNGLVESGEASRSSVDFVSTKSRAQVVAETVEAQRLGLIVGGEASSPTVTASQIEQIRQAGLRIVSMPVAQAMR